MASSSKVHTLDDLQEGGTAPNASDQVEGSHNKPHQNAEPKKSGSFSLPSPKPAPPEINEEPESLDDFKKKNPKAPRKRVKAHEALIEAWEEWQDYEDAKNEVEKMGNRTDGMMTIFDGQDFRNQDEAAIEWYDEMRKVIETDADANLRRAAYEYLIQHLAEHRYPELKPTCEHNKDRLITWANKGYKGNHPKAEFVTGKDENGEPIIAAKPRRGSDKWSSTKRRTEDAPEESPVTLPPEPYMSRIKGLWEEGTPMLHEALRNPEQIRAQPGLELSRINNQINQVKDEFVRSADGKGQEEKEKVEGIPDLSIPVGEILMMVVRYTEQAVREHKMDFKDDPAVKSDLAYITTKANRAGQGDAWIKNMEEAYTHHVAKAAELWASGADSLEKIHAREEFWNEDLLDWIMTQYMSSAPSQEAPAEWRSAEADSDRMSVDGDGKSQSAAQDPNTQNAGRASQPATSATAAEQSHPHTAQSQQEESGNVSGSSLPTTDDYTVNYGNIDRAIGGYKYCGIKSGGVHGFSVLISMKEDKFYHMVASSDVNADDSEPLDYLEKGGYLVGDLKDVNKRLNKGTSIEGKKCHVEDENFRDFRMSAYAIGARGLESSATRPANQYIKGHFSTGKYEGKEFWYSKSSFCEYGGFRKPVVQRMIETFKNEHGITLDDEVKLEDGENDSRTHWTKKKATLPENRGRDYFMDGFVVPDAKDGQSSDVEQRMEGFKKTMTEYIDQRIEKQIKELGGGMESRFQTLEKMMTAISAKLGV